MNDPVILQDSIDVNTRLSELGLNKQDLVDVAFKAMTAKNDSVAIDPVNAPGLFAYIYGTRAIREALLPLDGWVIDRTDNIESTLNSELGVKLIYQNVELACSPSRPPKAISSKGEAAARMVANATFFLFEEMEEQYQEMLEADMSVWFLCVSYDGKELRAELSRPSSIDGGQFGEFLERIFIAADNDWEPTLEEGIGSVEQNFEINVSKK